MVRRRFVEAVAAALLMAAMLWGMWAILGPVSPRPSQADWKEYREGGYLKRSP